MVFFSSSGLKRVNEGSIWYTIKDDGKFKNIPLHQRALKEKTGRKNTKYCTSFIDPYEPRRRREDPPKRRFPKEL